MNTAVSRPYGELSMISSASSSPSIAVIGTTGPNVSSRAISIDSVTRSRIVGWKNSALPSSGARRPPAWSVAPRSIASATWCSVFAAVRSLLSGPIVVAPSRGSPSRTSRRDGLDEQLEVRVVDRAVDEHPLAGGAALAGVQEAGGDRRARPRPRGPRRRGSRAARCRPSRGAAPCRPRAAAILRARSSSSPTNPIAATRGSPAISSPTSSPGPVTRLKTPGGRSASTIASRERDGA